MTIYEEEDFCVGRADEAAFERLTPREREIVPLLLQGLTNRAIAHQLHNAEGTVKKLVYNCYRKLGVGSRIELVLLVMQSPHAKEFLNREE